MQARENLAPIVSAMLKAQHRLEHAYVRLDKALKSAQKRLPTSLIDSWKQRGGASAAAAWSPTSGGRDVGGGAADGEGVEGSTCMICLLPVAAGDEDGALLLLPCGHGFHEECVRSWLHSNTTCPNCRTDLSSACEHAGEDGKEDESRGRDKTEEEDESRDRDKAEEEDESRDRDKAE